MHLGPKGILDLMNSMGGLPAASSFWSPGDKVAYIFPVNWVEDPDNPGKKVPVIPIGYDYGHNLNFGEGATFKRNFVPSKSVINEATNSIEKPDFIATVAPIFSELLRLQRKMDEEEAQKHPNEDFRKIKMKEIKDAYEGENAKRPAVSGLKIKAFAEVAVCKLDLNGKIVGGDVKFDYGSLSLSKKKLNQLIQQMALPGALTEGDNYFVITMQTTNGKKNEAGQVDYNAITDASKKLEVLHPDFKAKITDLMASKAPTPETIKAKVFDFKPYDEDALKAQVANYVNERRFYLQDLNGAYREEAKTERNLGILEALGLVATAEEIRKLMGTEAPTTPATTGQEAQAIDLMALTQQSQPASGQ